MKRLLFVTMAILLMARFGWADPGFVAEEDVTAEDLKVSEEPAMPPVEKKDINTCPHWKFDLKWKDCKDCHLVQNNMELRPIKPEQRYTDAPYGVFISQNGKKATLLLDDISPSTVENFIKYVTYRPDIEQVRIEIFSPGGSLMDAKRILGLLQNFRRETGHTITTTVYGWVASAAFYIWLVGDRREVGEQSELMWHELWIGKWLALETPTSSEQEAEILRHLQDTMQEWVASKCKLTKEELDEKIRNAEYWMNGKDAYEIGFATHLLPE